MPVVTAAFGLKVSSPGGPFHFDDLGVLAPEPDEVIVEVAGCGLCHTDIGFAYGDVPTRRPFPLVLGHEISGNVVDAGERAASWIGKSVIVPAVIPCGVCDACLAGRPTICRKQFMPGNDGDGGFASHVRVPARGLCAVPHLPPEIPLEILAVVADAVSTPYEAIQRAQLGSGDLAVFVGAGGVGAFGIQIAAASGAQVVAVDVDEERLELVARHGAAFTATSIDKKKLRSLDVPSHRWKIFETSGTTGGQQTAFSLLDFGSYLGVIGFTPNKFELRLSNLMAFDATARGNWGCAPANYPQALDLVLRGKVAIDPFVEMHPLEELP